MVHGYGADDVDILVSKLVPSFEAGVAKHINRKQKKILEELSVHLAAPEGRPLPIDFFLLQLARAEVRAATLLSGEILAAIAEIRSVEPELQRRTQETGRDAFLAFYAHPLAGDVFRFALSPEAIALRRRIGSTWA